MSGTSNLDTLPGDVPKLSVSASSPFLFKPNALSVESTPPSQILECKDNLKSHLPLSLLFTTSSNTTLSLQLSELIDQNTTPSTTNADKHNQSTPKQVKFKFDGQSQNYIRGDLVIISPNKQGLIRYIGPLHGDSHVWYGIELIGGTRGFNDGSFQGQRYFTCGIHQGIFVKKHQIMRKMTATDFDNSKPKRPKTAKKARSAGTDTHGQKRSSLTDIDLKRVQRKPGPREIGRIKKTSDWTPIEDADRIIEQHMNSGGSRSRQKQRPKTARNATGRARSTSRHEMIKAQSKIRINKSVTLLPDPFVKSRSKTPSPSRHGLIHKDKKRTGSDDDDGRNTPNGPKKLKATLAKHDTSLRSRSTSTQKPKKRTKKKRKGDKDKRKGRRSRSKTVQFSRSELSKSKSVPDRSRPMITFSFESPNSNVNTNTGFPDIATLGDHKSDTTSMRKKKKGGVRGRYGKHMQSKSTDCGDGDKPPMVIIRVSSEKNVDRRFLGTGNMGILDMSETSTIPMSMDAKETDDLLFAEVNAEIEQRKSGLVELEHQLDALGIDDFNKEFENSLLQTQVNQSQFTKRHSALVDKLEFDIGDLTHDGDDESEGDTDGISSTKIKKLLWSDLPNDGR